MSDIASETSHIQWDRPILVGSCPSSGSTLLSVMMDSHPDVACGPELSLFAHRFFWLAPTAEWRQRILRYLNLGRAANSLDEWRLSNGVCPYGELVYDNTLPWYDLDRPKLKKLVERTVGPEELVQAILGPVLTKYQKSIWAEKSPNNIYAFDAFLERFPQGRVVYLVRDGRDVVCSLMRRGFGFKRALSVWLVETAIAESYCDHPRAYRVKYEDLVSNPACTLKSLLDFLELNPDVEAVLDYATRSSRMRDNPVAVGAPTWEADPCSPLSTRPIGRWRQTLKNEQLAALAAARIALPVECFSNLAGQTFSSLLQQLGYDPIEAPEVNSRGLLRLVMEEYLLATGDACDKISPRLFQERFVDCATERLGSDAFSWDDIASAVMPTLLKIDAERESSRNELVTLQQEIIDLNFRLASLRGTVAGFREMKRGALDYVCRKLSRWRRGDKL